MTTRATEEGFSLIEALVAMLILAIATTGLIRAAEAHVDSIRSLELRAAAQIVAENRLVELGLPGAGGATPEVEMLGQTWRVATAERTTDDPDLRTVEVRVSARGAADPLVTLDGFVDAGSTTR